MYIPEHFEEKDPERIGALIEDHPFGMLVTVQDGLPCVNHLPFLFEAQAGRLLGHMARANPQWTHLADAKEVLVVFQGPNAYVSPSWYASAGVPTWNYAVVHLRGKPSLIEDESRIESLIERLTLKHESKMKNPWDAGDRRSKLFNKIVGFEIEVTEIRGKFKLSQNRPHEDRCRVAQELAGSGGFMDAEVARLMAD
ncbi:MAG: FMN-binding negative transcriptional regulator [Burkholderiales bacterium]|nr:FMN-binding negative transcriptional regulator [Burkholderiales bacterium]